MGREKGCEMKIISYIGTIGSGKSTKAKALYDYYKKYKIHDNIILFEEDLDNPYLELSLKEPDKYLFKCQEYIFKRKEEFYNKHMNEDVLIIEDSNVIQDLYYLGVMEKGERNYFKLKYLELYESIKHTYKSIEFIEVDAEINLKQIKKRGRDFESYIDIKWLENQGKELKELYERYVEEII